MSVRDDRRPVVLHLIESFRQGGSERQAVQLVRLLAERGAYRQLVACLNAEGVYRDAIERLALGPIEHYPLTSFRDANFVRQLSRFARHLRRNRVDVVHTHDFYTNVFGMAAARIAGVPVRIASRRETGGTRSAAQKSVERLAYRAAHAIVANAAAVREALVVEGVPAERTVTIHNGLDVARVAPTLDRDAALARFGLSREPGRRFVTIVANLRLEVKDHPTFLRAASRVARRVPEVDFVLAGEGRLVEPMRRLAGELGLGERARFIGECDLVGDLLAVSDVCVLSSRAEGFSNSILEYMAAARPVVATDVGGAREAIVEDVTGYVVAPGDDEALADRIATLLEDPERARRMGERGRERVARTFSCEAQRAAVEALYARLLDATGRVTAPEGVGIELAREQARSATRSTGV